MRKSKISLPLSKGSVKIAMALIGTILGLSLLASSGGTFAKWTAAISQMTGANIQIGDWVAVEPPVISSDSKLPDGSVGSEYRYQFEATNSEKATWSSFNLYGNLPAGLQLSSDGVISGTPTYDSTSNFRVTVRNIAGSDERSFTLVINPVAPVFAESQTLPDAYDGKAYPSTTLQTSGRSRIFKISSGELPQGLTLGSSNGIISGTPVGYGFFTFTVTVSNGGGSDSKEFTINLNSDYPYITTTALPDATMNTAYSQALAGSGPSPTYTVSSGALPSGLNLNPTTGQITGSSRAHGLATFTISKTNALGTVTKDLSIYVRHAAPTFTPNYNPPVVRKNVAYKYQLVGTGDDVTYAISEGSLPTGLTLDPVTGIISGTTSVIGDFDITVTKTNESGIVTRSYTITSLLVSPTITFPSWVDYVRIGSHIEIVPKSTGEEVVWSATGLVDGLSIDPVTGVISGTPSTIARNGYTLVTVTNSGGSASSNQFFIVQDKLPEVITTFMPDGEVGEPYLSEFVATGGSVTYSTIGTLPVGLKFDNKTGSLSGTPSVSGNYKITFRATNTGGSIDTVFNIVINRDAPTFITQSLLSDAMQSVSYSIELDGRGEASTHTVTSGAIPPGFRLFENGTLSGVPNALAHGSYTFTVSKTNTVGTATREFTMYVARQTPTLTGSVITTGRYGVAYTYTLPGVGNGATYTILDGELPAGIILNKDTGVISGTATVTGDFAFTVQKSNESGTVSKDYTFKVTHVAPRMISTTYERSTVGVPYSMQLNATGLDVTYSIVSGKLPDGVTLDANTGIISGTVLTGTTSGHNGIVRIDVTNSGGSSYISTVFYIDEVRPIINTTSLPQGVVGDPYSEKIEAVGENLRYSASGLPYGLVINTSTGVISGTPTSAGSYTAFFNVMNNGNTVQQKISMTVVTQAPTITTEQLSDGIVEKSYSQTLAGAGSSNTVTITSGQLPPGVRINSSSGALTGTPTTRGTYTFTITKTNVTGTVSKEFTIKISYTVPTINTTGGAITAAKVGQNYSYTVSGYGEYSTHSISEGSLPPGLSMEEIGTSVRIIGTPTAPGNYTFTIHKSNLDGEASKAFSINVSAVAAVSLPNTESNQPLIVRLFGLDE